MTETARQTRQTPSIRIPPALLPRDGRFGSGPSKVPATAVNALHAAGLTLLGTSHRQAPVRSLVRRLRRGLAELFTLPDGYEVALGLGGATIFWDAAIFGLIDRRSQHLSCGEFSSKFAANVAAAPHLDEPDVIVSLPGTHPLPEPKAGIDTYALIHNETSTGVMMDIRRPPGAEPGSIVLVDATSAAGGLVVDATQFDCYYFSPQKCFASDGGLWLALLSPAARERTNAIKAAGRWIPTSLDLDLAVTNSRQEQTLNTPALATLVLLVHQLEWMLGAGGLEAMAARCARSASHLYAWAEASSFATPFVRRPEERSTVVATIDFEGVDAATIAAVLRANGIVDTESYRKLGRNQLRIGLYPAVDPDDVVALTACIDFVVSALS